MWVTRPATTRGIARGPIMGVGVSVKRLGRSETARATTTTTDATATRPPRGKRPAPRPDFRPPTG
eukprot:3764275-Alexandrium_andersonii.AAC.1